MNKLKTFGDFAQIFAYCEQNLRFASKNHHQTSMMTGKIIGLRPVLA
jgi:hypothetical protein